MKTKTTLYLSDELRVAVKKHVIDVNKTLSEYAEEALWAAIKNDNSPAGKRKAKDRIMARELDIAIRELEVE